MTADAPRAPASFGVRVARIALPGFAARAADRAPGRTGILLELRAPDGRSGWGEASPLPGYAEESADRARAALLAVAARSGSRPALQEILRDPTAAAARLAAAGPFAAPVPGPDPLAGLLDAPLPPSARAALVSALFDLAGRSAGEPVRELLGARAPTEGPLEPVALNALVPLATPDEAVRAARAAVGRGISTLKAKLGPAPSAAADLDALRAIRENVGPAIAIRLDANGRWSLEEARRLLPEFAEVGPEYVEEPVSPDRLPELADAPVALAADESLRDPERARRLLDSDAVAVLVLKPGPLGGLDRCLGLARAAAKLGLAVVVTHAFEGPVGHAAACELALALRNGAAAETSAESPSSGVLACGLDAHPALVARAGVTVPQLRSASVVPASLSGLGVDPVPLLASEAAPPGEP